MTLTGPATATARACGRAPAAAPARPGVVELFGDGAAGEGLRAARHTGRRRVTDPGARRHGWCEPWSALRVGGRGGGAAPALLPRQRRRRWITPSGRPQRRHDSARRCPCTRARSAARTSESPRAVPVRYHEEGRGASSPASPSPATGRSGQTRSSARYRPAPVAMTPPPTRARRPYRPGGGTSPPVTNPPPRSSILSANAICHRQP